MLDINYIKENPQEVIDRLAMKGKDAQEDIAKILELDAKRRALIAETEGYKAEQNKLTKMIPQYKKEGKDPSEIFAKSKELGAKSKQNDEILKAVETELTSWMLGLPNLPDTDRLPGGKENNEPLRYFAQEV